MEDRVRRIFDRIDSQPDALIIANGDDRHVDASFFYLFDAVGGAFEGDGLVARPDGTRTVLTSPLEAETAHNAAELDRSVEVRVCRSRADAVAALRDLVDAKASVGLNFRELTEERFGELRQALPGVRWVDASDAIQKARRVKDADEIERIERAGQIVSRVATEIPSLLRPGVTELDLAAELEYRMARAGASGRSFETIIGFGAHSAEPHFAPGAARLERGNTVVCDFGALHRRYVSDLTRPFYLGPEDPEMRRVHATVLDAQNAALAVLRAGARPSEVHRAAQTVIDASPWKGHFTHRLGHSIGLSVHDGLSLNLETTDPLEPGETVTIEPGIYLPGRGGVRIEDDVLVTASGYRFLTTAPREYLGPAN